MRSTARLFQAAVKHLTPGAPTGLTGLRTHAHPRPALMYLYTSTLSKLQAFPESSVYRQSTEALTKQRLAIVQAMTPEGYEAWQSRINQKIKERPEVLGVLGDRVIKGPDGSLIVIPKEMKEVDERDTEWDGERVVEHLEGPKINKKEAEIHGRAMSSGGYNSNFDSNAAAGLEPEPPLTAEQINELEQKIGAGLIEEVIEVAKGEHQLVDKMLENKPWEELIEKAPKGQWTYFARGTPAPKP